MNRKRKLRWDLGLILTIMLVMVGQVIPIAIADAAGGVRRLTIDGAGNLTDTGEVLSVPDPNNVFCAPVGTSGVVINREAGDIRSFTIPGLGLVDTRTLSGTFGISGQINPAGNQAFARSNSNGNVDAFDYNSTTAALGASPLFTIPIADTPTFFGMDQIALHPNGTKLYVSQPGALNVYDASTGAPLAAITAPGIVEPTGVCFAQSIQAIGMVADNSTHSVTVFDADTDTVLGTVSLPGFGGATGDCSITADLTRGFVTDANNQVWVIDLTTSPPSLAPGTNPIPISNPGEDTAISPDQQFLVVCDGSATEPISVIDIATQTQISTFNLGSNCNSVDVCSDGSVLVTSTFIPPPPPANDDFDNATVVTAPLPFVDEIDTTNATTAADDPDCAGNGHTVWYSFTPTQNMRIVATTFGSNYDTTLSMYTGSRDSLTQIACNDDFFGYQSQVSFDAIAGATYFFMVSAFDGGPGGHLVFTVDVPPANDDFDSPTVVTAPLPFVDELDTTKATTADDDPFCAGRSATVWYRFTPTQNMRIVATTFGSNYDTTLSVYTGSRGSLTQIACNDNFDGLQSQVSFDAIAGATYLFMVSAFDGGPGGHLVFTVDVGLTIDLSIDPVGSVVPKTGAATIRGTVQCSKPASVSYLSVEVQQRIGRAILHGSASSSLECSGETPWSVTLTSGDGLFTAGSAKVSASASAYAPATGETAGASASRTVTLKGKGVK